MSVRIRLKKLGRKHRPFFRLCAMDLRSPRDGKVIEELGYYDPMIRDTDARAVLNGERIDYWLSVGAQPSDNAKTLIKKYGSSGTHLDQQNAALERLKQKEKFMPAVVPAPKPPEPEKPEEVAVTEEAAPEAAEAAAPAAEETPAKETPAKEAAAPAEETPAEAAAETAEATEEPKKESSE